MTALDQIQNLARENERLLNALAELVEAARRLAKADDDLLTLWDATANNEHLSDEYSAARAAVDKLIGG